MLPGATVTVAGLGLIQPRVSVTSETGSYRAPELPIGTYSVTFKLPGFRTMVRQDIRVTIGFRAQINGTLDLSSVQETVTVTGGVSINLVTKSGTDRFKGSGRHLVTDEALVAYNITPELKAQGAGGGALNPRTADDELIRSCLETDLTTLNNYNWKLTYVPFTNNRFNFQNTWAEKVRNARDASDTRPIETTYRQKAVSSDFGQFGPRALLEGRRPARALGSRSFQASTFLRPTNSLDVTSSYFLPNSMGGDHAFKMGYRRRTSARRRSTSPTRSPRTS